MTSEVGAANVMVIEGILGIPRPREVDSSWHTAHRRPRPLQTSIAFSRVAGGLPTQRDGLPGWPTSSFQATPKAQSHCALARIGCP